MDRRNKLRASLGAFLRILGDMMVLNILWLVCSLPVVTVGPATSALCAVSLKLARGEPVSTLRTFFTAFRRGIGQSVLLGLIGLAGLAVAAGDWMFAVAQEGTMRTLYFVVGVLVSAFSIVLFGVWWALDRRQRFHAYTGKPVGLLWRSYLTVVCGAYVFLYISPILCKILLLLQI